jgi:hyperosmotically inducible periplasmic protein
MRYVFRSISVATLLSLLLAGCTALTGKTAGRNIDDGVITTSVKTKLAADQAASTLTKIDVDTNQGTVFLNGNVENIAQKQRAAELAGQVEGVRQVVNNLQIQAR